MKWSLESQPTNFFMAKNKFILKAKGAGKDQDLRLNC